MVIKKNQTVWVARTLDLRSTGGPLIPEFAMAKVLIRRRDGRLWVDFGIHNNEYDGKRHLHRKDVQL
jgi:hypothetical protein